MPPPAKLSVALSSIASNTPLDIETAEPNGDACTVTSPVPSFAAAPKSVITPLAMVVPPEYVFAALSSRTPAPLFVSPAPEITPYTVSGGPNVGTEIDPPPLPNEIVRFVDAAPPAYSSVAPLEIAKFPWPNAELTPWSPIVLPLSVPAETVVVPM